MGSPPFCLQAPTPPSHNSSSRFQLLQENVDTCTDSSLWGNSEKKKRRQNYPSKRDRFLDMSHLHSDSEGDAEKTR